jgi:phosphonate transport system substrate-binding protein
MMSWCETFRGVAGTAAGRACVLALLLAASPAGAGYQPERYTLGVVPQVPPAQTHHNWTPLADRLSREVGAPIALKVYRDLTEFESDVARGAVDFAYLNPYQQVIAKKTQGYQPLVRAGKNMLSGALVVHSDGPIRSIGDLRGKIIGFPHPNAFGASLYMRALLREQFGIDFTPRYLSTHSNVYRHVLRGLVDAGGGVNVTLRQEPPEARRYLRVLYETPPVAGHPLSAHPRVTSGLRTAVTRVIERLAQEPAGQALLAAVNLADPVVADYARDYAPLERLRLEKLYVPGYSITP